MPTLICSTGTSAAKGVCEAARLHQWVEEHGGPEEASRLIFQKFADVEPSGEALQNQLSAEVHSLARIGVETGDRVVLLASETPDGHACALAVKSYLERYWPGIQVDVHPVKGLQVRDALRFRREGVVEFTRHCLKEIDTWTPQNCVLNPTGGFKALVPYTVLIGMLRQAPCKYIFEQSATLLDLPPFPIEVSRGPFEAYREIFERIESQTTIPVSEWEQSVSFEQRRRLDPLIEEEGGEVTLSAIGLLFLEQARKPVQRVPFLSRQAWKDCLDDIAPLAGRAPFQFLKRMQDPEELKKHTHINTGNGLRWLKPGNTTDRYLISLEGWKLLVWRAIREDQQRSDYARKIRVDPQRDRDKYGPFTRMEFADEY